MSVWHEDFEVPTFADLFNPDLSRWTNWNADGSNVLELSASGVGRGGGKCLRAKATPPDLKAQIERSFPLFPVNTHVWISLWVKNEVIQPDYEGVLLADLETSDIAGFPGRRLFLKDVAGYPNLEGKLAGPVFRDLTGSLALNDWVLVVIHYWLDSVAGINELWVNGSKRITGIGQNTPNADPTAGYNSLQIGMTANTSSYAQTWLFDDVYVSDQPLDVSTGLPVLVKLPFGLKTA